MVMFLSIFSTIILFLILMNIMIALMGNIQAIEQEHAQRNRLIYQLGIVVDNWVYNPLKNDNKTKYLVVARVRDHDCDEQ